MGMQQRSNKESCSSLFEVLVVTSLHMLRNFHPFCHLSKLEHYFWTQQEINTILGGKPIKKNMSNVNLTGCSYVKSFNSNILRQFIAHCVSEL